MRKFILLFTVVILLGTLFISATTQDDLLSLINSERTSLGRESLIMNSDLTEAAQLHSEDMATNNFLSHTSLDGKTFVQRILNAGYSNYNYLGENIAYHSNSEDASKVFTMWKNSPGHYSNMISSNFKEAGIGIASNSYTYYTLDLGKRNINYSIISSIPNENQNQSSINNPIPNISSTESENYKLFTSMKVRNTSRYNYFYIKGNVTEKSTIYYIINEHNFKVCSSCSKFNLRFRISKDQEKEITLVTENSEGKTLTKDFILKN